MRTMEWCAVCGGGGETTRTRQCELAGRGGAHDGDTVEVAGKHNREGGRVHRLCANSWET